MEIDRKHLLEIARSAVESAGDIFFDHDLTSGETDPKEAMKSAMIEKMEWYFQYVLGYTINES